MSLSEGEWSCDADEVSEGVWGAGEERGGECRGEEEGGIEAGGGEEKGECVLGEGVE